MKASGLWPSRGASISAVVYNPPAVFQILLELATPTAAGVGPNSVKHRHSQKECSNLGVLDTNFQFHITDIRDRMPAILRLEGYDLRLNSTAENTESELRLLLPYTGPMRRYPVSARVNQVQNDDADCARPPLPRRKA